jgi:hypothetical protein
MQKKGEEERTALVLHEKSNGQFGTKGVFTSHANPKHFLFHPPHRIFRRMHGALNVGKKDN